MLLKKYVLVFFAGILLMLSLTFYSEWSYEDTMLNFISAHVHRHCQSNNPAVVIDSAIKLSDEVIDPMVNIFGNEKFQSIKSYFISPSFSVYYYGSGACGGYCIFMARLLKKMGYHVKFVEQKAYGTWGAHITLGIMSGDKVMVVDPLYKIVYKDSLGNMVDIHELSKNWAYYKQQTPPGYKQYNYQAGWRYTNWDKLGFISRWLHNGLALILGEQRTDNISARSYFLSATKLYMVLSLLAFLLVSLYFIKLQFYSEGYN
jgi:hypothetical protein